MPKTIPQPEAHVAPLRPICVDLDGTLVKSDTLVDSFLVLLRTHPLRAFALPGRLLRSKAAFKAHVTEQAHLDVSNLPYNRKLLNFLREEQGRGRSIYLATGADERLARSVADHLGCFHAVLAGSDGATNLPGNRKLDRLRSRLNSTFFDYIGNDTPDLPLLAHASESMVANPTLRLRIKSRLLGIRPTRTFEDRNRGLRPIMKALRLHQWAKNLLLLLPLLLSHVVTIDSLLTALLAFCSFSLAASFAYVVNDLLDIEADRRHPQKRLRPFASGDLSGFAGLAIAATLLLVAFCGSRLLPVQFFNWLLLYLGATLAYSMYLKRIPLVDVLVLSGLYTLRLLAGSAATHSHISPWLAGFSIFLFFSLAIAKRFAELENLRSSGSQPRNGRGYLLTDIEQLRSFGTSSAFAAVVVFALYISSQDVVKLYTRHEVLWLVMPLMVLWLCRVWLLASRGKLDEDPLVFALSDKMSLLIGVAVAAIMLLAV